MLIPHSSRSADFRGFTILSILMAVMIIGALIGIYLSPPGGRGSIGERGQEEKANWVACEANRNSATVKATEFQLTHGRFPLIAELERVGESVPRCPDRGKYYILDGQVYCTFHIKVAVPPPH